MTVKINIEIDPWDFNDFVDFLIGNESFIAGRDMSHDEKEMLRMNVKKLQGIFQVILGREAFEHMEPYRYGQ